MSKTPRSKMLPVIALAAAAGTLALGAWAGNAPADEGGRTGHHHRGPAHSVERVAMRNLIVKQLAARTGRSEAEVGELLQSQRPHEAAETLGIDREAMKEIFASARSTLIDEAVQAQLITTAQAEELKSAPPPGKFRHHRRRGDADRAGDPAPDDGGE